MADHRVAYLRWDVRRDWKRLGGPGSGDRRLYPYAYGSNWRHFREVVKPGSTLWVVAAPLYGGSRLPPTLIAQLVVRTVRRGKAAAHRGGRRPAGPDDYAWVAEARRDASEYYPLNNAFHVLTEIEFENSRGRRRSIPKRPEPFDPRNPYQHVPGYLQNICRVAPGDESGLEALARQIRERRIVFLSYARQEAFPGTGYVSRLVDRLRARDFSPWIDLGFVPQPEEGVEFADPLLRQILEDGLRQAGLFVALSGPLYRERFWTGLEWRLATARSREQPLGILQVRIAGEVMDPAYAAVDAGPPAVVARRVCDWWEERRSTRPGGGQ